VRTWRRARTADGACAKAKGFLLDLTSPGPRGIGFAPEVGGEDSFPSGFLFGRNAEKGEETGVKGG
jgi:hypothetical protein